MKALRNLIRTPARSALLIVLMAFLSCVIAVSFLLRGLIEKNISARTGPLNGCVKVSSEKGGVGISFADAAYIAENFGIIGEYHAFCSVLCDVSNGKSVAPSGSGNDSVNSMLAPFTLHAVTETETRREFFSGERVVAAGSWILREHHEKNALAAVISDSLAKLNGWSIGDSVFIETGTVFSSEKAGAEFRIVGIYTDLAKARDTAAFSYQMPENEIYIPLSVYGGILSAVQKESPVLEELYYRLSDSSPAAVSALCGRLRNTGISGTPTLVLSSFSPETEAENLVRLSGYVNIAIVSSSASFAAILSAVLIWNFHSREREAGIYCSLGAKRGRIAGMFFRENIALFFAAFLITSAVLFGLWLAEGKEIFAFAASEDIGNAVGTSLETVLHAEYAAKAADAAFADPGALIFDFVLPAITKTLICCGMILTVIFAVSYFLIKKLDVMRVLGGEFQ